MTTGPALVSVNVGMPKDVSWQGKTVYTGVWKRPVDGAAMVRRLNIDGDGQGDLGGHGGEQRKQRAAWQHTELPAYAGELKDRAAFAWSSGTTAR